MAKFNHFMYSLLQRAQRSVMKLYPEITVMYLRAQQLD